MENLSKAAPSTKDLLTAFSRLHHLSNIALDIGTDPDVRDAALIKINHETESLIADLSENYPDKDIWQEVWGNLPTEIAKELGELS